MIMKPSALTQEKDQSYYNLSTAPSLAQSGDYNSKKVKEVPVAANLQSGSESLSKTLPCRLINGLPAQTLKLNHDDVHSNVFNEVVRRIKPCKQIDILEKISKVTESQVEKIVQCRDNPAHILNHFHDFFISDEFPYVNLRAFRDGEINVNEFATLASLHATYQENRERNELFEMKFEALFEENGEPNKEAWKAIEETIHKAKSAKKSLLKGDIDFELIINQMQAELKTASPLEAGFWHYDMAEPTEVETIADHVRDLGAWVLTGYANQEMTPSISMIQAFINTFGAEAHRINPVIGASTVADIRLGGIHRYRDFALPFPGIPLPKIADYYSSPTTATFQIHDLYHLMRVSGLKNSNIDLYIKIGDALQEQQNRYGHAISTLKTICQEKFTDIKKLEEAIERLPEPQKTVSKVKFQKELNKLVNLLNYLKKARKATGQFKFGIYDLDFTTARHDKGTTPQESVFAYYLANILQELSHFEGREQLNGMPAKLAGRIVLPFISGELDNPSQMYDEILKHNFDCNLIFGFDALSDLTMEQFNRYRNFIDCLKSESTSSLLENQPEKTTLQGSNEGEELPECLNDMSAKKDNRNALVSWLIQSNNSLNMNDVLSGGVDYLNSMRGFFDLFKQTTQEAGGNKKVKVSS